MLVSGMIIGTVFTLFVVPSIYMLVARTRTAATAADRVGGDAAPLASDFHRSPALVSAGLEGRRLLSRDGSAGLQAGELNG